MSDDGLTFLLKWTAVFTLFINGLDGAETRILAAHSRADLAWAALHALAGIALAVWLARRRVV